MKLPVLDHGYVEGVRVLGDDNFLAECARMSTDTVGTDEQNARLVRRLIRDKHTSPIEFGVLVVEVVCPLFVVRQWQRHRTGAFNEFSGRYSEFGDTYYVPTLERMQKQSTFNNQGSAESFPEDEARHYQQMIIDQSEDAYKAYRVMVDAGVTREVARIVLPTNFYTKMRWKIDLHNVFNFLRLREAPDAQWEVQQYANALHTIVADAFPAAVAAFENHIQNVAVVDPATAQALARLVVFDEDMSPELRDFKRRYDTGE